MDLIYLELVLQDFTLKQLSMINWLNNNLDENVQHRHSRMLDVLREISGAELTGWTPLKIQQGIMAAQELGFLGRDQEKDMDAALRNCLAVNKTANKSVPPYKKQCCDMDLKTTSGRNVTVFGATKSSTCKIMIGICENCNKQYSHNFFIKDKEKIVTREAFSNDKLLYFGGDYAYEKSFINLLTNSIMYLYSGFENFTKCFNATKRSSSEKLDDASVLSPARVQDFWFIYNYINCSFFYTKEPAVKVPLSW